MPMKNDWWLQSRMRRIFFAFGLAAGILLVSWDRPHLSDLIPARFLGGVEQVNFTVARAILPDGMTVVVEVADSPAERARGLSDRGALSPDAGMLFTFDEPDERQFWMKDMRFPIDIVWIRDGRVIGVDANVPVEDGPPWTTYRSPESVDAVLELNAGMAERHAVTNGEFITTYDMDVR